MKSKSFDPRDYLLPDSKKPFELQLLVMLASGISTQLAADACKVSLDEATEVRKRRYQHLRKLRRLSDVERYDVVRYWMHQLSVAQLMEISLNRPCEDARELERRLALLERFSPDHKRPPASPQPPVDAAPESHVEIPKDPDLADAALRALEDAE